MTVIKELVMVPHKWEWRNIVIAPIFGCWVVHFFALSSPACLAFDSHLRVLIKTHIATIEVFSLWHIRRKI